MALSARQELARSLDPQVVDLSVTATENRPLGALRSTDSEGARLAAWLQIDTHDFVMTSPSVMGFEQGQRFVAIAAGVGTPLPDLPLPVEG
jgi:hypothetical protein